MHDNPAVRNFNPHSRVGSDHGRQKEADRISNFNPHSHEGATIYGAPCKITVQISIHTPTRERHKVQIYHATDQIISIHTPAWGATQPSHGWRKWYTYFNPHSRVGSDNINRLWWMHGSNFNPHSRVGSDPARSVTTCLIKYFNPHSRVGSDTARSITTTRW